MACHISFRGSTPLCPPLAACVSHYFYLLPCNRENAAGIDINVAIPSGGNALSFQNTLGGLGVFTPPQAVISHTQSAGNALMLRAKFDTECGEGKIHVALLEQDVANGLPWQVVQEFIMDAGEPNEVEFEPLYALSGGQASVSNAANFAIAVRPSNPQNRICRSKVTIASEYVQ